MDTYGRVWTCGDHPSVKGGPPYLYQKTLGRDYSWLSLFEVKLEVSFHGGLELLRVQESIPTLVISHSHVFDSS